MPKPKVKKAKPSSRMSIIKIFSKITVGQMVAGALVVASALVLLSNGYEKLEPAFPVLHFQLRPFGDGLIGPLKASDVETKSILRDIQIENAERNRQSTLNAQEQLKVQLNNPVVQKDRDLRESLNRQYIDNQNAINKLDAQINTLRDIRNKGL